MNYRAASALGIPLAAGLFLFLVASTLCASTSPQVSQAESEIQKRSELRATAITALRQGDRQTADLLLRRAARGNPDSSDWRLDYAQLLLAAAIDLQDRNNLKLSTDYFRRAAVELNAALEVKDAPVDPRKRAEIYHHLGFIARVADDNEAKAISYLQRALAADPGNKDARTAIQRTKSGRRELQKLERGSQPKPDGPNH